MITPEIIADLVKEKAELVKKSYENRSSKDKDKRLPEFYPTYKECIELWDRIKVHAVEGTFPDKLLADKAPNQKESEWEYQKRLYKAIGSPTYPFWAQAQSKVNRIWNEKNYSITFPNIEAVEYRDSSPVDYFTKDFPLYGSIESFFKSVVSVQKINDPNAWLAIDVMKSVSDTEAPRPYGIIYNCKDVWEYKTGYLLLVKTDQKSEVKYGGRTVKEGIVLKAYCAQGVYLIKQYGLKTEFLFSEPELEYEYRFNTLQAWPLKGTPINDDNMIYYQSYFMPAVSSLNSALLDGLVLQMSKIVSAFPERWEYVDDCNAMDCEGGLIWDRSGDEPRSRTCTSCNGTGRKNMSSPLSVIEVQLPKGGNVLSADTRDISMPPAGYIEKAGATEQLIFLRQEFIQEVRDAFAMIHISVSTSEVKGSDTALGKQIDREEMFSFLLQISNELFDLLYNTISACGEIRYPGKWDKFELGFPQNFAIRNDWELTQEISDAKAAGIPDIAIQKMLDEYSETRFNSQTDTERVFDLVFAADRLISYTNMEVLSKLAVGTVSKEEEILHTSINFFIKKAERNDPLFWEKDKQEQIDILKGYAADEAALLAAPKLSPKEIIEQINAKKADAATELRGTVGGITAILGIITAVGMGQYSREAAIELLKTTYQFTDEEAAGIVGETTPIIAPNPTFS